jgi:hypothetical protein
MSLSTLKYFLDCLPIVHDSLPYKYRSRQFTKIAPDSLQKSPPTVYKNRPRQFTKIASDSLQLAIKKNKNKKHTHTQTHRQKQNKYKKT